MNQIVNFLKTVQTIHLALFVGQLLFALIVFFLNRDDWKYEFSFSDASLLFAFITANTAFFLHKKIYKKTLEQAHTKQLFAEKLAVFQKASIVKFILIEGATVLCIIFALIYLNFYVLLVGLALIAYFFRLKPDENQLINDLKLSKEFQEEIKRNF